MELSYFQLTAVAVTLYLIYRIFIRLRLSRAKHPSLRGHSKMSRKLVKLISYFSFDETKFYSSDNAPTEVVNKRRQGLASLQALTKQQSPKTLAYLKEIQPSVSDLEFTSAYRVPFPFREQLAPELKLGSIVTESRGIRIKDLDGNWRYDLSGSYGVNVFGYDFYKSCLDQGIEKVKELGPVLGPYHPIIKDNVERLKKISGLDEISFHMSGTEAVMQAVRLARYHTGKTHLVRFCGAYHGWWDGVQPGVGNQRKVDDVYTLNDLSENALKVLATRKDIACVLVNPLQAFHPNSDSASDATLIASTRSANFNKEAYSKWLKKLRDVCTQNSIVLIFDEVFTGFRLSYRGAQEYFGINADLVTYGKTLGGGLPVGVLCGRHQLMKRFKPKLPAYVSFARGTFNSHPYVMGTMNAFLQKVEQDEYQQVYRQIEQIWNERIAYINRRFEEASLPIKFVHMHTVLSLIYTLPSRYNWMLQFYFRANGIELAWIGSGRLIMPFSINDKEFEDITSRMITAANQMQADGWWWQSPSLTNDTIKKMMLKDILSSKFPLVGKLLQPNSASASTENTIKKAS